MRLLKRYSLPKRAALCVLAVLLLVACGGEEPAAEPTPDDTATSETASEAPDEAAAALEELVAAAQEEGALVYYTSVSEGLMAGINEKFFEEYGIMPEFVRAPGSTIRPRYIAESESGVFTADLLVGPMQSVAEQAFENGWAEPVQEAGIPVVESGEFPDEWMQELGPVINVDMWSLAYNTELIDEADLPTSWLELADPKYKGMILTTEPTVTETYVEFWDMLLQEHGEDYLTAMAAQDMRFYPSGAPGFAALGAGEGPMFFPATPGFVLTAQSEGAPVDSVTFDLTTGSLHTVILGHRDKIPHPNAARLFVNFLMGPDGLMSAADGSYSAYDDETRPKEFQFPRDGAVEETDRIKALFGR